jgi:hypothetical protein
MTKNQRIEKFIRECFDMYLLNYFEFFSVYDDECDEVVEIPILSNGKLQMPLVERAAKILGVPTDALM